MFIVIMEWLRKNWNKAFSGSWMSGAGFMDVRSKRIWASVSWKEWSTALFNTSTYLVLDHAWWARETKIPCQFVCVSVAQANASSFTPGCFACMYVTPLAFTLNVLPQEFFLDSCLWFRFLFHHLLLWNLTCSLRVLSHVHFQSKLNGWFL